MENFSSLNDPISRENNFIKPNFFQKKIIFSILGVTIVLIFFYFLFLSAPVDFPIGSIINIREGVSLRSVSLQLKKEHVIRSTTAFEVFVIIFGGEKHVMPADYLFESKISSFEVARRISKGERHLAPVRVMIPEGFNVSQIANTFSSKLLNFNKDKFLINAKEGYLFPDTYFFFTTDNEQNVLKSMNDNFEKKIKPIRSEIISSGKNEKDIITMASLIEREAKGDSDRGLISGILWKRLSLGRALEVDVAPETYKARGLPKNPVCNPGLFAIKAAIHPISSPYLYYLHDKEGKIHFARNFEEHINNRLKYLK